MSSQPSPSRSSSSWLPSYQTDGCAFPIPVLSGDEAAHHRAALENVEAKHGPMHYVVKPYLIMKSAAELGRHPAVLDAVEAVIGPDILLWDSAYIIKEAESHGFVAWHQDLTYWGLDGDQIVSAWIALSPSNVENGCVRFIPGTHTEEYAHEDEHDPDNILHRGQKVADIDESGAVDIVLQPGEMSLHHGMVVHASQPNASAGRRIGLSLQYLAPVVKQTKTDKESATLVRGKDPYGHFLPEPACVRDLDPKNIAFQQEVERLKHEVYDTA